MRLTFHSVGDLEVALKQAAAAHGKHEEEIGEADPEWPAWYAAYMMRTLGEDDDRTGRAGAQR